MTTLIFVVVLALPALVHGACDPAVALQFSQKVTALSRDLRAADW